jgi:hypothetical protein
MYDLLDFYLGPSGGIAYLAIAFSTAALLTHVLRKRHPTWRLWQVVVVAALPLPSLLLVLTVAAVIHTRHEDGMVPLVLGWLGIALVIVSFGAGLVSSSLMSLAQRR